MQWVETTGSTIEEAKELALDQLGIDGSEAEFEVLEEPKIGLFGRVRGTARVRARVVPKAPRPKQERRARRPKTRSGGGKSESSGDGNGARQQNGRSSGSKASAPAKRAATQEEPTMTDDLVSVEQQADVITEFLEGLLDAFGAEGTITREQVDDDTIELEVAGADLGVLIGPKGQTLSAVHELSRTVLQRRETGRHEGRVRIDIGGYRRRRAEALARFVRQQAEEVISSGVSRALEPMNAVDRKIVHDTVNEVDGASTVSEGVDPNRRVVIVAEGADA